MELAERKCSAYKPGSPPITRKDTVELLKEVPGWLLENGHLTRTFTFEKSEQSIAFLNDVLTLSTEEGHIPDLAMREGRYVEVGYYSYPAGGLTLNDFIMAAKINERQINE
ncbi:MAG: 4a-hydroxytetrahydrobiopterin dehydratase [Methanoregula sp.]|uniref:4a-hydroxytetrahydrobiopterin dehydratase n=1 Tax=Methanoregula sp. TaxID=2052170 RepID=UPI003BB1423D